jgi:ABC-type transport system involved in cytochrome bd biosynthesis fused ATPase/permease subunit
MKGKRLLDSGLEQLLAKAVDLIRPPFMKLLVVLAAVALAAFAYIGRESAAGYLLAMFVLLLLFALLAFASVESERRYRHAQKTQEELKKALREKVQDLWLAKDRVGAIPRDNESTESEDSE